MKKLFLLALTCLTLSLGFTACDDDDDDFDVTGNSTENLEPVDFNLQTDLNGYFNGTMGITAYSGDLSTGGGPFYTEERTLTFTPNSDGTVDIDFGQFKVSVVLFVTHMKNLTYEKCTVEQTNDGCEFSGSAIISEEDADYETILEGTYNKRTNSVSLTVTILAANPTNGAQRLGDDWTITFDGDYATEAIPQTSEYNGPTFTGSLVSVYNGTETVTETPVYTQLKDDGSIDYFVFESLVLIGGSQNIAFDDVKVENLVFDEDGNFEGSLTIYLWGTMPLTANLTGNINDVDKTLSIVSEEAVYSDLDNTTVSIAFDGETTDEFEFVLGEETEGITYKGTLIANALGYDFPVETTVIATVGADGSYTKLTISELSVTLSDYNMDINITNIPISNLVIAEDGTFTGTAHVTYEVYVDGDVDVSGTISGNDIEFESETLNVLTIIPLTFSFEGTTDDIATTPTTDDVDTINGTYTGSLSASVTLIGDGTADNTQVIVSADADGSIVITVPVLSLAGIDVYDVVFEGTISALSDGTYTYSASGYIDLSDLLTGVGATLNPTGTISGNTLTMSVNESISIITIVAEFEGTK